MRDPSARAKDGPVLVAHLVVSALVRDPVDGVAGRRRSTCSAAPAISRLLEADIVVAASVSVRSVGIH